MAKSPCIGCEFELADKNNPTCRECDRRVEYVALIAGARPGFAALRPGKQGAGTGDQASLRFAPAGRKKRKNKKRNAMKNKLLDLNNYMFAQMERLSDKSLKGDKLTEEITRSKAISTLSVQIINNAKLALDAHVKINELLIKDPPKMLGAQGYEEKE